MQLWRMKSQTLHRCPWMRTPLRRKGRIANRSERNAILTRRATRIRASSEVSSITTTHPAATAGFQLSQSNASAKTAIRIPAEILRASLRHISNGSHQYQGQM
eukprot:4069511-Prymnesium_polylepis.3